MKILDYKLNAIMAKARAMYGKRLTLQDYVGLSGCKSCSEIVSYLKGRTSYADAFENTVTAGIDEGYVEFLIKKLSYMRFATLCRYEMSFGEELHNYFIVKEEINQILLCIKSILLKNTDKYVMSVPAFYSKSLDVNAYDLMNIKTIPELIDSLEGTDYQSIIKKCYDSGSEYLEYECELFNYFYEFEYKLIKKSGGKKGGELFELLSTKADTKFIDNIYRTKKYFSASSKSLIQSLAPIHLTGFTAKQINALLNAADEKEILSILKGTKYKNYAEKIEKTDYVEQAINEENYKMYKHLLRFSTNPNVTMFCFMFLESIEVSNIIHIIEGVKYKMSPDEIKSLLIGVGD
ncbi:MAG: V-type ATPase subunit [Oscillospiraceae bacterium]|nr:V-type ATPase subunit [Oscillospiraceae bacterium]